MLHEPPFTFIRIGSVNMRKRITLFILASLIFLLPGCTSSKPTASSGTSIAQSMVSSAPDSKPMRFDKLTAYFGVSRNSDTGYSRYLFLYGTVGTTETDNNRLSEIFRQKYDQIDFLDKKHKLYSSKSMDWTFNDSNTNEKNITLAVPCQIETAETELQFDRITLHTKEGELTFNIGNCRIALLNTAETKKLSCVESPLTMQRPSMKFALSYAVMMTEKTNSSKYNFHLETGNSSYWKIENTGWTYDEALTKQLKTEYSSIKTDQELQYLKAYRINVTITLTSKTNIVIKPVITAEIDGKKVYCTTEPFFLKF